VTAGQLPAEIHRRRGSATRQHAHIVIQIDQPTVTATRQRGRNRARGSRRWYRRSPGRAETATAGGSGALAGEIELDAALVELREDLVFAVLRLRQSL
jgi:hypothetical protein